MSEREDSRALSDLQPGQEAEVVFINPGRRQRLERLSAMGIVAGARLRLVQRQPVRIVMVGHTELALDHPIARDIYVRLTAGPAVAGP
jgi:Fe2+ transport system protein FeoA